MVRPYLPYILVVGAVLSVTVAGALAQGRAPHMPIGPHIAVAREDAGNEQPFRAASGSAMDRMMLEIAVRPTGSVDRDFVAMMVPHHRGAIEMSLAFLQYGKDERLRRIAQEIIVTQQQEIEAMQRAVSGTSFADAPAP